MPLPVPVHALGVPESVHPEGFPIRVLQFPEPFIYESAQVFANGQLLAPQGFREPEVVDGLQTNLYLIPTIAHTRHLVDDPLTIWSAMYWRDQ